MADYVCSGCEKPIEKPEDGVYQPSTGIYLHGELNSDGNLQVINRDTGVPHEDCTLPLIAKTSKMFVVDKNNPLVPLTQLEQTAQREG